MNPDTRKYLLRVCGKLRAAINVLTANTCFTAAYVAGGADFPIPDKLASDCEHEDWEAGLPRAVADAFHVRFVIAGRWFKITDDSGGAWVVLPCDCRGAAVERLGRPAELVSSLDPEASLEEVAAYALLVGLKWSPPEIVDRPVFRRKDDATPAKSPS